MSEWIYFIHPPRENFAETMTAVESCGRFALLYCAAATE